MKLYNLRQKILILSVLLAPIIILVFSCAQPPPQKPEARIIDFGPFMPSREPSNVFENPIDGSFFIYDVIPTSIVNNYIQKLSINIEATSQSPWSFGDFGHPKWGSLWIELLVKNKVLKNNTIHVEEHKYLFSIKGIAAGAGTAALVEPHLGQQYHAGTNRISLIVSPLPRIKLTGVKAKFEFGGDYCCWYSFTEIIVTVHSVDLQFKPIEPTYTYRSDFDNTSFQELLIEKPSGSIGCISCD